MSITLSAWAIPAALTVAIWSWGILKPFPASPGDYDFSGALSAAFRLAVCITVTLSVWLIYFAVRVMVGV
jgi:hypothetical protein